MAVRAVLLLTLLIIFLLGGLTRQALTALVSAWLFSLALEKKQFRRWETVTVAEESAL